MAFVQIPKDLNKVKEKVMFNLTKRQLICFGIGGGVGLIAFFIFKSLVSIQAGVFAVVISAFPAMFFSIYEKDGQPPEKIIINIIKAKFINPKIRIYKTENLYAALDSQIKLNREVKLLEKDEGKQQNCKKPTKTKKRK